MVAQEGKEYAREPFRMNGRDIWQACYVCGKSITFDAPRDNGQWLRIGDGYIRHKKCLPPPAR